LPLPIGPCAYRSQTWTIMSTAISVGRCAPSRAGTGGHMRQLQARPPRQPRRERNASSVTSRCCCRKYKGKNGETILPLTGRNPTLVSPGEGQPEESIMSIRTSLRNYACTAVALVAVLSGRGTALSQQDNNSDIWMAAPFDLTLRMTQALPVVSVKQ